MTALPPEPLHVGPLPLEPLASAAAFHTTALPLIEAAPESEAPITLVFLPADHTHTAWRLAAVQSLARMRAPCRVNAVVSGNPHAIAAAHAYLLAAPGVTGQLLTLDGTGAGAMLC